MRPRWLADTYTEPSAPSTIQRAAGTCAKYWALSPAGNESCRCRSASVAGCAAVRDGEHAEIRVAATTPATASRRWRRLAAAFMSCGPGTQPPTRVLVQITTTAQSDCPPDWNWAGASEDWYTSTAATSSG